MVFFTESFFYFSLAVGVFATCVQAAPWPSSAKYSTHRVRYLGKRQLKLETYHPTSRFNTYGSAGKALPMSNSTKPTISDKAMSYVDSLGVNTSNVNYHSGYQGGNGTQYAYLTQTINGISVANAVSNVAMQGNKVIAYATSFVDTSKASVANPNPSISWRSVLSNIEDTLDSKYNGDNATLEYITQSDGSLALAHVIELENPATAAYYKAYIDAHSGNLLSVVDYTAHASYTVLPLTKQGFPEGVETLVDPEDLEASPFGWHSIGLGNSTTTSGNNVMAVKDQAVSVESAEGLNFNAQYNDSLDPQVAQNINAARTNAFYVINSMHDFSYRYGFTESAFNFQLNNFDKGGADNDRVAISVQDASGTDNAVFVTPPDGKAGTCRMFIWTTATPNRDGAMNNDIVIHEMTHGITNRMVGGGRATCLQGTESGGLGEGWGDAMADWMRQTTADTQDTVIADYAFNNPKGLRSFPYSTDPSVNPLTYANVATMKDVHGIGEVWANMLHNVYAALVDERGFSPDKLTNPDGPQGNIVYMQIFIKSLPLMPCNPTFVQARDAWIQADANLYNGANKCTIFRAFASRGLGLNADNFVDDNTLPAGC